MTLSNVFRTVVVAATLMSAVACGDSTSGIATPTSPSVTVTPPPAPVLSLAGTWTGRFSGENGAESDDILLTWTATQNGALVSGPIVLRVGGDDEGDEVTVVTGTLQGTVDGAQLTGSTFNVAAGGIPIPEFAICTISGTGVYAATATSISGAMVMTFGPAGSACIGDDSGISNSVTETWQLSLAK
jgi:hypothetical protein